MSEKFAPPVAHVGQLVLWFPNRDANGPAPALVTKVGTAGLNLQVFLDGLRGWRFCAGVRHIDDPAKLNPEFYDQGFWKHSEETELYREVGDSFSGMAFAFAEICDRVKDHGTKLELLQRQVAELCAQLDG